MSFYFIGQAPLSKSLLNRAFITKSWFSNFKIEGSSDCDDVKIMEEAVCSLDSNKEFYCGLSGTAFRFLVLRLSRKKGNFFFTGEKALWNRPFKDLSTLLSQLGVEILRTKKGWSISSQGWNPQGDYINVPSQVTSQYASALVLNSWDYERDIYFTLTSQKVSYSYFEMTLSFVKELGMDVRQSGNEFYIPKRQSLKKINYKVEQDKSCLFALAAFAILHGKATFTNWERQSVQPDAVFLNILKDMGVSFELKNQNMTVYQSDDLQSISKDLSYYPDLFPVLSVLCAKAEGLNQLSGLSHQAFKESDRLSKTIELLDLSGIKTKVNNNTLSIYGKKNWPTISPFSFNVSQDHRMVIAAQLVKSLNVPITIQGKDAVNKSFPEFFSLVEGV